MSLFFFECTREDGYHLFEPHPEFLGNQYCFAVSQRGSIVMSGGQAELQFLDVL